MHDVAAMSAVPLEPGNIQSRLSVSHRFPRVAELAPARVWPCGSAWPPTAQAAIGRPGRIRPR